MKTSETSVVLTGCGRIVGERELLGERERDIETDREREKMENIWEQYTGYFVRATEWCCKAIRFYSVGIKMSLNV